MYKSTISNIFNRHVPIKRKYICANEAPFVSKELYKTIMKISRLRNIFLEYTTDTNKKSYNTQRNLCKKLLRNTMKSYFENLETIKKKMMITEVSGGLFYYSIIYPKFIKR